MHIHAFCLRNELQLCYVKEMDFGHMPQLLKINKIATIRWHTCWVWYLFWLLEDLKTSLRGVYIYLYKNIEGKSSQTKNMVFTEVIKHVYKFPNLSSSMFVLKWWLCRKQENLPLIELLVDWWYLMASQILVIICIGNGLLPNQHQAIPSTNTDSGNSFTPNAQQ